MPKFTVCPIMREFPSDRPPLDVLLIAEHGLGSTYSNIGTPGNRTQDGASCAERA